MKTKLFIFTFISFLVFQSCDFKTKGRLQEEAFELQQLLLDEVVNAYSDIKDYKYVDENQDERLKIIFQATDSTFNPRKMYKKIEGTDKMAAYFVQLKEINTLLNTQDLENKVLHDTIINELKKVRVNIDSMRKEPYFKALKKDDTLRINSFVKEFDNMLIRKKIKDIDYFSSELMFLYSNYWKSTLTKLRRLVAKSYKEIVRKIEGLPIEIFNERKLRDMLEEPFSDAEILINMYKMKMIEAFMQGGTEYNQKLKNITLALDKMVALNKSRFGEEKTRKQLLTQIEDIKALVENNKISE